MLKESAVPCACLLLLVACGGTSQSSSSSSSGQVAADDGGAKVEKDAGLTTSRDQFAAGLKIFVTQAEFNGALGGVAGAAKRCQAAADSVGLAGTFVAVLSDLKAGAFDAVPPTVDGPWYANHYPTPAELNAAQPLEDGPEPLAFRNRAALKGDPSRHIGFNEKAEDISRISGSAALSYWTGAEAQGEPGKSNCVEWTSDGLESGKTGSVHTGPNSWITGLPIQCVYPRHLLCIQIK